jgi:hypothetical protein
MPIPPEAPTDLDRAVTLYELFKSSDGPTTAELVSKIGHREPGLIAHIIKNANKLRDNPQALSAADAYLAGATRGAAFLLMIHDRSDLISQLETQLTSDCAPEPSAAQTERHDTEE